MEPNLIRPSRTLRGKVAIVTGAGAVGDGIGNARAAAILLAEDGCNVVCVDRELKLAQRTVEMIQEEGKGDAVAVEADITQTPDCESVVKTAVQHYGRVDILFNCVGVGGASGTAVDVNMDEWAKGMEINVGTMVRMSKFAIPEMIKNDGSRGYKGSIVNMGSVAGIKGGTPHLLYPTSKGAVVNLTRAMAAHHAQDGIRVNCVCPGMVYTPMMYANGMSPEARESRKNRSLLKVEGTGWDVGAAVRFLSGEEARWITGEIDRLACLANFSLPAMDRAHTATGVILPVDAGVTAAVGTDIPKSASVNG